MKKYVVAFVVLLTVISVTGAAFMFKKKPDPVYLTLEQLSEYNGKDGKPAYVAVEGKIYDLTKCRYWKGGIHDKSPEDAIAGRDMTEVLKTSKHGFKRVSRFPVAGYIVQSEDEIPTNANE